MQIGAEATFERQLSFSEIEVLKVLVPYVTKNLTVVVTTADKVRARADGPGFTLILVEVAKPNTSIRL